MKLTIVGCVDSGASRLLIDCGATALIGLERVGIDPNSVDAIQISHLHGDHFSGLVWWYLHAVHVARRRSALTVAGPAGIELRFRQAAEVLFRGRCALSRRSSFASSSRWRGGLTRSAASR